MFIYELCEKNMDFDTKNFGKYLDNWDANLIEECPFCKINNLVTPQEQYFKKCLLCMVLDCREHLDINVRD